MQDQPYWIGVDLHSRVIQACVLNGQGDRVHEQRHRGEGLDEGLEFVEDLAQRFPRAKVVVEAIGMNRWFVRACEAVNWEVTVAHAAGLGLKSSGRKTDRRDAYELARRHQLGDVERNALSYHPTDEEYGWRQLLRQRHGFVQDRSVAVCRIRAMLRTHRAGNPGGELYRPIAIARLRKIQLRDELEQQVLRINIDLLEAIQQGVAELDKELQRRVNEHPQTALLLNLPYVGPVTAGTLYAELGDVRRFRNAKAVASYAGLVPRVHHSADQTTTGRLVKHGNREIRFVLGEWAVQLLTKHPLVKAWAVPKLARIPKNKVRVALARKLLIGVWHTMRTGETFCLKRCLATA